MGSHRTRFRDKAHHRPWPLQNFQSLEAILAGFITISIYLIWKILFKLCVFNTAYIGLFDRSLPLMPLHQVELALMLYSVFAGKKLKSQRSSKIFFSTRNCARNIYKLIFIWIVDEVTHSGYFFLYAQQKSLITKSRQTHALQKNLFKTPTLKHLVT